MVEMQGQTVVGWVRTDGKPLVINHFIKVKISSLDGKVPCHRTTAVDHRGMQHHRLLKVGIDIKRTSPSDTMRLKAPVFTIDLPCHRVDGSSCVIERDGIFVDADIGLAAANGPVVAVDGEIRCEIQVEREAIDAVAAINIMPNPFIIS